MENDPIAKLHTTLCDAFFEAQSAGVTTEYIIGALVTFKNVFETVLMQKYSPNLFTGLTEQKKETKNGE